METVEMHSSIIVPDKNLERCTLISQPHTTDTAVSLPSPYQYLQSNQKTFSDSVQIVKAVFLPAHRSSFRDRLAESIFMEKGKCTSREGNSKGIGADFAISCWEFVAQILLVLCWEEQQQNNSGCDFICTHLITERTSVPLQSDDKLPLKAFFQIQEGQE